MPKIVTLPIVFGKIRTSSPSVTAVRVWGARHASSKSEPQADSNLGGKKEGTRDGGGAATDESSPSSATEKPKRQTVAEKDEELRLKMSGLAGDGGASGVEYEDGQPVSMKRSVKNNMFRYI